MKSNCSGSSPSPRYHWVSKTTGEIVPTFKDVLRVALADLCNFHVVNVVWTYSKEGW